MTSPVVILWHFCGQSRLERARAIDRRCRWIVPLAFRHRSRDNFLPLIAAMNSKHSRTLLVLAGCPQIAVVSEKPPARFQATQREFEAVRGRGVMAE